MATLDDPRQERFLLWLLTPPPERQPKTQVELCKELGMTRPKTLTEWKQEVHFKNEYDRRWRQIAGHPDRVKAVVDKLQEQAAEGNVQAAKLYLEWAREYTPRTEVRVEGADDLRSLSDEELQGRLAALRLVGS